MVDADTTHNTVARLDRTVRPLAESWVRSLRADGKSARTIQNYVGSLLKLTDWSIANNRPTSPGEQSPDDLRGFVIDALEHAARGSVVLYFRCLQQWFKWLVDEEEIDVTPMAKLTAPKLTETTVPIIPEEDLAKLLAVTSGNDIWQRRDHAIIRTFVDTGMRLGELVGMQYQDVELDRNTILIHGKGDRKRLVPIGTKTVRALDRYRRKRDELYDPSDSWWTGKRATLGKNGVGHILRARAEEAGIAHVHAHQFRHTAAHRWLAAGGTEGDLMKIAGWKNPAMLQRYGRSAAEERAREAHKRLALGDSL